MVSPVGKVTVGDADSVNPPKVVDIPSELPYAVGIPRDPSKISRCDKSCRFLPSRRSGQISSATSIGFLCSELISGI